MIAGFIFGCNNDTLEECLDRKLFGVPLNFFSQDELNEIKPGIPLFLFNYSTRYLYGGFEATCNGCLDIVQKAFKGRFPVQVKVKINKVNPTHISENVFKPIIADNYFSKVKFKHALNEEQVRELQKLFFVSETRKRSNPSTEDEYEDTEENEKTKHQKTTNIKEEIVEEKINSDIEQQKLESVKKTYQNTNKLKSMKKDSFVAKLQEYPSHVKNENLYAIEKSTQEIDLKNIDSEDETRTTLYIGPLAMTSKLSMQFLLSIFEKEIFDNLDFIYIKIYDQQRMCFINLKHKKYVKNVYTQFYGKKWDMFYKNITDPIIKIEVKYWNLQGYDDLKLIFGERGFWQTGTINKCISELYDDRAIFLSKSKKGISDRPYEIDPLAIYFDNNSYDIKDDVDLQVKIEC